MTLEELKKLIVDDEGETLEVKESTGQRRDACETLCAFLNKDGGTVRTVKTGTSEVISKGRTGMAEAINEAIRNEPGINKPRLVRLVGKSRATVERAIVTLVAAGKIEHRGSKKTGGYYAI
jgi:predicted HTH transcriptional regulator